ncbi:hypothetical protein AAVH_33511, partial [Aphelenchoides avenae]
MHSPDDYIPGPSPGPSPSTPVPARSQSEQPPVDKERVTDDPGGVAVKQEAPDQEAENVRPSTPPMADASRKRPAETPAAQTAVKQEPTDSIDGEVAAKRSRQAEPTPASGETGEAADQQQEPEDFGEAVFADESQKVLLYESLVRPGKHESRHIKFNHVALGATLKFLRAGTSDEASFYVCARCAAICKQRKLKMGRLVVQDGRLMTDPEVINGEGHGHYCLEELAGEDPRQGASTGPLQTDATAEQVQAPRRTVWQAHPSVEPTEPAPSDAQAAEAPVLRAPKREPLEDPDVELLDGPRLSDVSVKKRRSSCASSSTNTPSLPPLTASTSFSSKPSVAVAYFGDAVYDHPGDPSSFTYESDLYGSFKFVLLDEVEKEEGGQRNVMRLYRCEACFERKCPRVSVVLLTACFSLADAYVQGRGGAHDHDVRPAHRQVRPGHSS